MSSFDIVSEVNLQEIDNAVNQAAKEISTRYDFRGSKSSVQFDKGKKEILLIGDDDFKIKAIIDILQGKVIKRGISLKALQTGPVQEAAGGLRKCGITLVMGIQTEKAKEMVKIIKDSKIKVQASIQDQQVRISGKSKDDLQTVIALMKEKDFGIPLQFGNYRD